MEALAYRIIRLSDEEVLFEGIVRHSEDSIYPAQTEPHLLEEFPDLPHQCELHHFQVKGLAIKTIAFDISWNEIMNTVK
jgi:hypothetical protein